MAGARRAKLLRSKKDFQAPVIRTCPACGLDSPADRPRCYNCNASLEREPLKPDPVGGGAGDTPTARKKDLWTENYSPDKEKLQRGATAAQADQFRPAGRAGRGSS